jgi:hypothetical protein
MSGLGVINEVLISWKTAVALTEYLAAFSLRIQTEAVFRQNYRRQVSGVLNPETFMRPLSF